MLASLFEGVDKELVAKVKERYFAQPEDYDKRPKDTPQLYLIESGGVNAVWTDNNGYCHLLAHLKAGDFFGEIQLFLGRGSAMIEAVNKPCRIRWLNGGTRAEVLKNLWQLCEVCPGVWFNLMAESAWRLWRNKRYLASKNADERVLTFLLVESDKSGNRYVTKRSQSEIARETGLTERAVRNALCRLREQNIVQWQARMTSYSVSNSMLFEDYSVLSTKDAELACKEARSEFLSALTISPQPLPIR